MKRKWVPPHPYVVVLCGDHVYLDLNCQLDDDDDEIAYFTVRWKTRASFVYRTKNMS